MHEVDDYILDLEDPEREICSLLHDYLSSFPNIFPQIKFRVPFYYGKSWICYLHPLKKGGVELCFSRGIELSNANGILQSHGRKQVLGVTYKSISDIDFTLLEEVYAEAIELDRVVKYKHPKRRG